MALHHTIQGIDIPAGMIWVDEFDWVPVQKSVDWSLTGAAIVQTGLKKAGRPITLEATDDQGWYGMTRAKLIALRVLAAAPDATYTLKLADGRTFTVAFAEAEPITSRPIVRTEVPAEDLYYIVTLKFMEL